VSSVFEALRHAGIGFDDELIVDQQVKPDIAPVFTPPRGRAAGTTGTSRTGRSQSTRSSRAATPARPELASHFVQLYFSIDALRTEDAPYVIQFVSSTHGEGTSTTALEFARVAAAETAKPVLIVDCAPGNGERGHGQPPTVIELHRNGPIRQQLIDAALPLVDGAYRLRLGRSAHPLLEIDAEGLQALFASAKRDFDVVVLDCPPTTVDPQSSALARHCDGSVLVVRAETARKRVVEAARASIERHGGQMLGVAFNRRRFYIPDWLYRWL